MPKAKTIQSKKKKINISKNTIIITVIVVVALGLLFVFKSLFIVALVNGQPISRLSIIKEIERQGGKQTLETIITRTILLQEAKKKKINVSQADVDNEIKKVETNVTAQGLTLESALEQSRMTKKDFNEYVKINLLAKKLAGDVKVTDKEVEDYIASQEEQLTDLTQQITKDRKSVV